MVAVHIKIVCDETRSAVNTSPELWILDCWPLTPRLSGLGSQVSEVFLIACVGRTEVKSFLHELRGISGRVWKLRLLPESAKMESARVHPDTRPTANLAGRIKVPTQRKVLRLECEWLIISTSSGSTVTARDVWRWRRWEFWRAFCVVNFYWPWDAADGWIVRVCVGVRRPPQCVNTCICTPLWFSFILVNGKKENC